jgi:fibronectin type 3 domain-containing protein
MKKLISAILILCLCLGIYSCSKNDEDDLKESTTTTTDTTAPTVTSVSTTANNQSAVSITDNITVTFSEAMDATYVTTSTSDTNCAGTIRVSPDNFSSCVRMSSEPVSSNSNKTFTLDPYDNLTRLTTYLTRVTTGVKDTAGNAMISQYETSSGFTSLSLSTPSNLTATGTAGQVTLDWNAVSGSNSYTVYWDNATGISSSSTAITSISTDNYTHSSLDNGSIYYYKVVAVDSDNITGSLSSEVSAATPLPAPDNLSVSGANNTITLTWNSVSGATSYTLYWDNVSGIDNSDTAITSITNDNYTHNNMDNGSTYYYKVAAVNSSGTGTLSSVGSALLSADIQGSQTYNAHTYAITSAAMTFAEAKAAAAAVGGYLTTVNTKAENTFLTNEFYAAFGNKALWIGANDIATEDTWVWDNGTTSGDSGVTDNICGSGCSPNSNATWADGTRKWNSNEPNDSGSNEDCANITNSNGRWNDLNCANDQYGIIEFD